MKKHDEGYALVLVLVVITVLCLVAMAMMAASLKNLTNQQSSIERMQAKYQAQGEIEKVMANMETVFKNGSFSQSILENACTDPEADADNQIVTVEGFAYVCAPDDLEKKNDYICFTLCTYKDATESNVAKIECTIWIEGDISKSSQDDNTFKVENLQWSYHSYTIVQGGGE